MKVQILNTSDNIWLQTLQSLQHDIYQLPEYFDLEAVRNNSIPEAILLTDNHKIMFVPYLLRSCKDIAGNNSISIDMFDAVSAYGYPGILLSEAALKDRIFSIQAITYLKQIFRERGVCSVFLRLHPILNQNIATWFNEQDCLMFNGKTISINLNLSNEEIWKQTKRDRRKKILDCMKVGLKARIVNFQDYIQEFSDIYQETMRRVGADKLYYSFDYQYFVKIKDVLKEHIHLCIVELNHQIVSAGLYTEYNGIVQAIFRGTKNNFLHLSPASLEIDYVRFWAKQRGNHIFHLGGGLGGSQNNLYNFKASFSKQRYQFMTMRLILDEEKYIYLVKMRAKELKLELRIIQDSHFFPAYRYAS